MVTIWTWKPGGGRAWFANAPRFYNTAATIFFRGQTFTVGARRKRQRRAFLVLTVWLLTSTSIYFIQQVLATVAMRSCIVYAWPFDASRLCQAATAILCYFQVLTIIACGCSYRRAKLVLTTHFLTATLISSIDQILAFIALRNIFLNTGFPQAQCLWNASAWILFNFHEIAGWSCWNRPCTSL